MTQPTFLIDASIYIFKAYFALPPNWRSCCGRDTEAVYGFATFLLDLLARERPEQIAVCFDQSLETGFRHRLYPAYKSSRALPDASLAFQLDACRQLTDRLGIANFASETYEADDLIGSLVHRSRPQGPAAIISRDKDLGQLLDEGDLLWDYQKGEGQIRTAADIEAQFGVQPQQLADYLALVGDSSDDIPGVPGIGPKTAAALLQACGDIQGIFSELDQLAELPIRGASKLAEKLLAHTEQIALARTLAQIVTDIELEDSLKWRGFDLPCALDFCAAMGLGNNVKRRLQQLHGEMSQ